MKSSSPYKDWSIEQRIARMLQDEEFRQHCLKYKKENPQFDEDFAIAEKIAFIDISSVKFDDTQLYPTQKFSIDEIKKYLIEFYKHLDSLSKNDMSLLDVVKNNSKYVTMDNHGDKTARSYCSSSVDKNGEKRRDIFINPEGRIGDISTAIHEMGHSLSQTFIQCQAPKDRNMSEIAPVILDAISNYYLSQNIPSLESNFNANAIHTQIQNVIKAREVLLDGLVIKLMLNEITLDEVKSKFGDLFLRNTNILKRCLENIETYKFTNMYEKRYLIPQAVALKMLDLYKTKPEKAIEIFKEILQNDANWTVEETLKYLGIDSKQSLIDNYVENYDSRMDDLLKQQDLLV